MTLRSPILPSIAVWPAPSTLGERAPRRRRAETYRRSIFPRRVHRGCGKWADGRDSISECANGSYDHLHENSGN
jgi:hypothetical protein